MFNLKRGDTENERYWKTKKGSYIFLADVIQGIVAVLLAFGVVFIVVAFMATRMGLGNKVGF